MSEYGILTIKLLFAPVFFSFYFFFLSFIQRNCFYFKHKKYVHNLYFVYIITDCKTSMYNEYKYTFLCLDNDYSFFFRRGSVFQYCILRRIVPHQKYISGRTVTDSVNMVIQGQKQKLYTYECIFWFYWIFAKTC